jgi:ribosomal protein S12 methylthiotransferase
MSVQQPIAFEFNRSLVGQTLDVLIDAPAPEGRHLWLGRPYTDAPDVDGTTWVRGTDIQPGDLVACEIVASEEYDLIARPASNLPPKRRKARPKPRRKPYSSLAILDGS